MPKLFAVYDSATTEFGVVSLEQFSGDKKPWTVLQYLAPSQFGVYLAFFKNAWYLRYMISGGSFEYGKTTDGYNVTKITTSLSNNHYYLVASNNKLFAFGENGNIGYWVSTNGSSFTHKDYPSTNSNWGCSISVINNAIFLVMHAYYGSALPVYVSFDGGSSWSQCSGIDGKCVTGGAKHGRGLFYNNQYILWGMWDDNSYLMRSDDGINWTRITLPFSALYDVCQGDGKLVVTTNKGIKYTTNLTNWISATNATVDGENVVGDNYITKYIFGRFYHIDESANNQGINTESTTCLVSDDGITWTKFYAPPDVCNGIRNFTIANEDGTILATCNGRATGCAFISPVAKVSDNIKVGIRDNNVLVFYDASNTGSHHPTMYYIAIG